MAGTAGRSGGHNRASARRRQLGLGRKARSGATSAQATRPTRPAWLVDAVAVAAWERIVVLLEERGTLSEGDGDAVLLGALAESEYRQADELIAAEGLTVNGRAHPLIKVRADAWKRWSSALSRLGLDPMARNRVDPAPEPKRHNPFASFK
jgi:P27 family predicted phage terminase small subunit